jgi:hypothetical protein
MQREQRKPDLSGPINSEVPAPTKCRCRHYLFRFTLYSVHILILFLTPCRGITLSPPALLRLSTTVIDDETDYRRQRILFNTHMTPNKDFPGRAWSCNVDGDDSPLVRSFSPRSNRGEKRSGSAGPRAPLGQTPSEMAFFVMSATHILDFSPDFCSVLGGSNLGCRSSLAESSPCALAIAVQSRPRGRPPTRPVLIPRAPAPARRQTSACVWQSPAPSSRKRGPWAVSP